MRAFAARVLAAFAALALLVLLPAAAQAQSAAVRSLDNTLGRDLGQAHGASGAYVVDLNNGQSLFSAAARVPRMPASVEKLYTTSTALLHFGPSGHLQTSVLGVGQLDSSGVWHGTLYLKGGGDPTFGSQSFDHAAYGGGATVEQLVSNLLRTTPIRTIQGRIVGDESRFDSLRGTPPYGFHAAFDIEGLLSALAFNRGFANPQETAFQSHPAVFAAQQFAAALKARGVRIPAATKVRAGRTPPTAKPLAAVASPKMSTLIQLTNTPSDNYLAEMLLKNIGASFGGKGSTAAGAAVVRATMAAHFRIHPVLEDGSGLSRRDHTSPMQVVKLLRAQAGNAPFKDSLAVAGETGTVAAGLRGTYAQGRCQAKTGTLNDVASLAGYCTSADGHTLAFAFLMNSVDPNAGHSLEYDMAVAVARYSG